MRIVPDEMTKRWERQAKVGDARPVCRATIQSQNLHKFPYDTAYAQGGSFETDRHRVGHFTSFLFGDPSPVREIRNIQTCDWDRSVDQDAGTCTLTFLNSEISPIGNALEQSPNPEDFDQPGYYTFNRGNQTVSANRWGYDTETGWNGVFVPDRIVKTYEGYGHNPDVAPALDENLMQSGVWLIDRVTYGHDGSVSLEMRDLARLLLDQIVFPPVIPYEEYPLTWSKYRTEMVKTRVPKGGKWEGSLAKIATARSSNDYFVGEGLTDPPYPHYVTASGGWNGHEARHALVNDSGEDMKYWASTGQSTRNSHVWWEMTLKSPRSVAGLRLHPRGGPYRAYISIHDGSKWLGKRKIPYRGPTTEGVDVEADIPFVRAAILDRGWPSEVDLPRNYSGVKRIRITFTRLHHWQAGNYPYRAGLRDVHIYTGANGFGRGEQRKVVGNYGDYTHIVKWVAAWGGFYWPPAETGKDFMRFGAESGDEEGRTFFHYDEPMSYVLPDGRAWGDWMKTGTTGEADLTVDKFDKQPLMDIINYVRDLTGFSFWIDETGGVVWRMPNLWSLGNYLSPHHLEPRLNPPTKRRRSQKIVHLDEKETLLSYRTVLDSSNLRERIFVANTVGGVGTVIKGYVPFRTGLRRMAGWTDQNFESKDETRVMADMVSARQMFTYRRGMATIPGYPAIQIDDQVRIFERVTNETYYHYVMGIKSSLNMDTGEWTYDLETHWLGERPEDAWTVLPTELPKVTKRYLDAVGYSDTD